MILLSRRHVNLLCLIALLLVSIPGFSQSVAFNTTSNPANTASGLDIDFSTQGFLIPRVTLAGLSSYLPLGAHVTGMMVFNSGNDIAQGLYFDNGTNWIAGPRAGSSFGEIQYWSGTAWTPIAPGLPGQYLAVSAGGIPEWTGNAAGYAALTTASVSNILTTTATCGGNVTSDGGYPVSARGVCWSTSPGPTTADAKTTNGSGTGSFTSSLTGLTSGTGYYVRAWSTNSTGTSYGPQVTFTTN